MIKSSIIILIAFVILAVASKNACFVTIDTCHAKCTKTCEMMYRCVTNNINYNNQTECKSKCSSICIQNYCCPSS